MLHRVEVSPSSRAGCQNRECKEGKVKIQKGELRVGSWVDTDHYQAYVWRHWGCTTPTVIANMIKAVTELFGEGADHENLDGFSELPDEYKEKIARAFENGHIDDEDWKGDVEMNRPGRRGFRLPKPKAPKTPKADEEEGEAAVKDEGEAAIKDEPADDKAEGKAAIKGKGKADVKAKGKAAAKAKGKAAVKAEDNAAVKAEVKPAVKDEPTDDKRVLLDEPAPKAAKSKRAKKGTATPDTNARLGERRVTVMETSCPRPARKSPQLVKIKPENLKKDTSTTDKASSAPDKAQSKKKSASTTKAASTPAKAQPKKKGASTTKTASAPAKAQPKKRGRPAGTTKASATPEVHLKSSEENANKPPELSERAKRWARRNPPVPADVPKDDSDTELKAREASSKRPRLTKSSDKDNKSVQSNEKGAQSEENSFDTEEASTQIEDPSIHKDSDAEDPIPNGH